MGEPGLGHRPRRCLSLASPVIDPSPPTKPAARHDHASQYLTHGFQKGLAFLGIDSPPAFVRAPEGNGGAERFIRTLKENPLWLRTFATVEGLRQAVLAFKERYNQTRIVERHGRTTPAQVRAAQLPSAALAA